MNKKVIDAKMKQDALSELSSFLYDAFIHSKEKEDDKIKPDKGQSAENHENIK